MNKTELYIREFYLSRTKHISDKHYQSIILLSRWLVFKIFVISTWFGAWLINCVWFNWIIIGFFILTLFYQGWGNFTPSPELSKISRKRYEQVTYNFLTFSLYLFRVSMPILTVSSLFEVAMRILLGHPKNVQNFSAMS